DDAEHLEVPPLGLGHADALVAARRRRDDELARAWAVRPGDARRTEARRRVVPAGRPPRAGLRRRQLEQAGDPLRRAPALRPALRRSRGEVQGLLRAGQLLAL